MPKFGDLDSKFSKKNVRFESSYFKIGCRQNFVKIKKLMHFVLNCPHLGIWAANFRKQMSHLKSAPLK